VDEQDRRRERCGRSMHLLAIITELGKGRGYIGAIMRYDMTGSISATDCHLPRKIFSSCAKPFLFSSRIRFDLSAAIEIRRSRNIRSIDAETYGLARRFSGTGQLT